MDHSVLSRIMEREINEGRFVEEDKYWMVGGVDWSGSGTFGMYPTYQPTSPTYELEAHPEGEAFNPEIDLTNETDTEPEPVMGGLEPVVQTPMGGLEPVVQTPVGGLEPVMETPIGVLRPVLDSETSLAGEEWMNADGAHLRWANNDEQIKDLPNPHRVLKLNKVWYGGLTLKKRLHKGTLLAMNQEGFYLVQSARRSDFDSEPSREVQPSWIDTKLQANRRNRRTFRTRGKGKVLGGHKRRPRGLTDGARAYLKRRGDM